MTTSSASSAMPLSSTSSFDFMFLVPREELFALRRQKKENISTTTTAKGKKKSSNVSEKSDGQEKKKISLPVSNPTRGRKKKIERELHSKFERESSS